MPHPLRLAIVAIVALLTMLTATGTAMAGDWQYVNADSDAYYDVTAIDRDDSGFYEDIRFDLDNDGLWDTRMYNTRFSDNFLEVLNFDMDENGSIETQLRDADQREGFDYILVDRDQNGYWDPWRGYTQRIIPGSHIDHVTASNRRNASSALIHNTRQQTGVSLLYPSLPGGY